MSADTTLYDVRADNGLGGIVLGRDAADTLVTTLGARPDVLTVVATPLGNDVRAGTLRVANDAEMEHYLMFPDAYCRGCEGGYGSLCDRCANEAMAGGAADWAFDAVDVPPNPSLTETLAFLGHGEQL